MRQCTLLLALVGFLAVVALRLGFVPSGVLPATNAAGAMDDDDRDPERRGRGERADDNDDDDDDDHDRGKDPATARCGCQRPQGATAEYSTARIYIEHNGADENTGVHGIVGATGTRETCIFDSNGELIFAIKPQGNLQTLGVTDTFFESREPPNTEPGFTLDDILTLFPEGTCTMAGVSSVDGQSLTGTALFTHTIPEVPVITWPTEDAVVPSKNLVVTWKPVTGSIRGGDVNITGYQVIVTKDVEADPNSFARPVLDVHVLPSQTSLSIPNEFLEPGTPYELEVLAIEFSGNQTIGIHFFETQSPGEKIIIDDALILLEQNATAVDTGLHFVVDTPPWNELRIIAPDGGDLISVNTRGRLADFGLTIFSFESRAPPNAEVPIAEVAARFPEGEYRVEATSIDGEEMEGIATLTHALPHELEITSPQDGEVVGPDDAVISWNAPTGSLTDTAIELFGYELTLSEEWGDDPPEGFVDFEIILAVSPDMTSVNVPFLEPGTPYRFELIAMDVDGSQTAASSGFETMLPVANIVRAVSFTRGDVDASGLLDLSDAARIFGYLFLGQAPLPAPGVTCGTDGHAERGCEAFTACP